MKKIYIFTAVLALLTVSLNAQLQARKNVVAKSTTTATGKVDIRPDAFFRMGPSRASTTPVTPPYSNGFDSSDEWSWWETIDVDGDGNASNGNGMWTLYSNQARYRYHSTDPADDWLITAPVTLKAGKIYKFSFLATTSTTYDERLEVKLASSNSETALSNGTEIIPSTAFRASMGRTFSNENITVSADGNYYFGIHAISDANMYYLYIDNVVIDVEITDPTIQTSASSVTMNSIPGATVTETVTVTGKYLTDDITTSISGTNAAMFSVRPASLGTSGGELTISYTPTAVGSHTATLTLSSTDAEDVTVTLNGTASNDLTICDGNNTNYHLPIYGNYAEQLQVNQMIYPEITSLIGKDITSMTFYVDGTLDSKLGDDNWVVKLGTTNQTGYTSRTRLVPDDIQEVYSGYLTTGSNTLTITFDTPFTYYGGNLLVDFEETVTSGDYSSTSFYGVSQSESTGFYSYNNNEFGDVEEFLPKVTFTFEDSEPRHDLAIALSEPEAVVAGETATITATVTNNGNQTETGYTVTINGTSQTATEPLAPGATATFTYDYTTSTAGTVTIAANVACTDDAEANNDNATTTLTVNAQVHDLAIALSAPASVVGGNTATVTATVTNTGNQPVTGYTVTITDGTNSLLNQTVTETLAPGATATYTADYATTEAQVGNTVNFNATVACTGDDVATNNDATASMSVISMPAPENVVATPNDENQSATVTWNAPNITSTSETVVWDFEEEADLNAFTIVDADGDNYNWYWHENTGSGNYTTNSGNGVIASESYNNDTQTALNPDNWLISPQVTLGGTLKFYAAHQATYPENFAVYICTGSYSSVNDFVKISPDITTNATMTEYSYDLSQYEGQGYFAIRHYGSNDNFILLIDDISYSTREDAVFPESYNIYLDGQLVGSVDADDPLTYTFNNVSGEHQCAVSAVYPGGIESAKVPATFNIVPKTDAPNISVTSGEAAYTITATATDPTAAVVLTIDGVEHTGTGSVSVTIDRGTTDQNVAVSATAQENGKLVSDPAEQNVTVPMLPVTPTPEITYTQTSATVVITATGEGTVYLEAGGQTATGEGTVSITIMRSLEDQTVTASAVAVAANHQPSAQALESVPVPALTGTPATAQEGLLRMHLLIADQLKAEIPDNNSHPDRYGYVLRWEQPASVEDHKESGTVEVEIQKTEAKVNGYYTLDQIDADVNVGINHDLGLTMDVLTADASMFLPGENPDVLYYQMQGKEGENPGLGVDYLTQLQYMKNVKKYEEMLATSPNKTHQYPANETYHYFNDSEPIVTGIYNNPTSFITYAPSVSTWGIQRRYFEVDHLDNTYGAPIWKTAVGQVKLNSAVHERQTNQWNSVNWKDEGGNDCSLYILDNIEAEGYLPHTGISNVEYEPYMFRVFVESKNGKLRPYTVVPQGDGNNDGEHLVAGTGTTTGPICVWSGYYMDGDVNGMTFSGPRASETVSGQMKYVFTKVKVDRSTDNVVNPWDDLSDPWNDFDTIKDPETGAIIKIVDTNRGKANAMFGALDNLAEIIGTDEQGKPIYAPVSEDDLKVFVRFYYVAAGTADGHVPDSRAGGATYPAGYGTESPGKAPSPWTIVNELRYHGEIVSQTYVNTMGMQSDRPFDGVNIVITRYSDGTTSTTKVLR